MEATLTSNLDSSISTSLDRLKLYTSTRDLTLHTFWTICIDGVLSRLIYEGNPTREELQSDELRHLLSQAWQSILIEHADTVNSEFLDSENERLRAEKEKVKIKAVATMVLVLRKNYFHDLNTRLKELFESSGVQLDYTEPFQYQRDLDRCLAVAQTWQFELTKIENQINKLYGDIEKKKDNQPLSYKFFYKNMIRVATISGIGRIDPKAWSVMEYDVLYCELMEKNNK